MKCKSRSSEIKESGLSSDVKCWIMPKTSSVKSQVSQVLNPCDVVLSITHIK